MNITYQGEKFGRDENAATRTVTYTGTRTELKSYLDSLTVGNGNSSGEYVSGANLSQKAGDIWQLEITYSDPTKGTGDYTDVPNTAYGKKSARLDCGVMSVPIENLPEYLMNWNHYLMARIDSEDSAYPTTPDWWETADYEDRIPVADRPDFRWVKDAAECPLDADSNGKYWVIIEYPTKPGVTCVDMATYRIVESVKCKTAKSAGQYAANIINTITTPNERLGISKSAGNWKCDGASVSYNGKAWIATMTYTMTSNSDGWDEDLYKWS